MEVMKTMMQVEQEEVPHYDDHSKKVKSGSFPKSIDYSQVVRIGGLKQLRIKFPR